MLTKKLKQKKNASREFFLDKHQKMPQIERPSLVELERKRVEAMVPSATYYIKLICGVLNNAAWMACLDAYEVLKPLKKRTCRHVIGGDTVEEEYKKSFRAFKKYERNLIYSSEKFFCVANMEEGIRKDYGAKDLTDEKLYDFWAAYGSNSYGKNKNFLTCLVNKFRLIYEANNIKDSEAAAWSMGACVTLCIASDAYSKVIQNLSDVWGGCYREWQRRFESFDITHIGLLWSNAHKDMFPELDNVSFSDFEYQNLNLSIVQWAERLISHENFKQSAITTIADFTDDIFRTKGCAKKAIKELTDSKLFQLK